MATATLPAITQTAASHWEEARAAQVLWAATPVRARLKVLRETRHELARLTPQLAAAVSSDLSRTPADTRVAEILPLLAACRFLEQCAAAILARRRLGRRGLPLWLAGVASEVHRVALGHVLVIGPANYPLFLPGVQALQALAAGNAVTWKPGLGGRAVAVLFAEALRSAGLPSGLLHITGESIGATREVLAQRPDKVFFTGSAETGRILLRELADTLTPSVMELSGCDAAIVLPSADPDLVVRALAFGLRLNGSATCMAPRRVLLVDATPKRREALVSALTAAFAAIPPVKLSENVGCQLRDLFAEARLEGAAVHGNVDSGPVLVTNVQPTMRLAQADLFAPVLSMIDVEGEAGILAAQEACSFALTASIFGEEVEARRLAAKLTVGSILINDLIVPAADPRLPFGGRRQSGFGVTRGAEGLLEMTAVKTVAVRRGKTTRHLDPTTAAHEPLFDGLIAASHAGSWSARWQGLLQIVAAGKALTRKH